MVICLDRHSCFFMLCKPVVTVLTTVICLDQHWPALLFMFWSKYSNVTSSSRSYGHLARPALLLCKPVGITSLWHLFFSAFFHFGIFSLQHLFTSASLHFSIYSLQHLFTSASFHFSIFSLWHLFTSLGHPFTLLRHLFTLASFSLHLSWHRAAILSCHLSRLLHPLLWLEK